MLINKGNYAAIPNVSWSWLNWEADLIGISKAWYTTEYEIKISKADFEKDFKKRKHYSMTRGQIRTNRIPNYFCYVAPLKAIPLCIPDHAGLILIKHNDYNMWFEKIKGAPRLHNNIIKTSDMLAILRSVVFKYWDLAKTLNHEKRQKELLQSA
jgi:hypothetical protein